MVQLIPLLPQNPSSLASFKSRLVLPFWYQFTRVVLGRRPLNGCSSSSSSSSRSRSRSSSSSFVFFYLSYLALFATVFIRRFLVCNLRSPTVKHTLLPSCYSRLNLLFSAKATERFPCPRICISAC